MKVKRNTLLLGLTILLVFTASQCTETVRGTGEIRGIVWDDKDKNGVMTDGEDRVPKVEVQLLNVEGEILKGIVTDGSGFYKFERLELNPNPVYEIKVILPPGKAFTDQGRRDVDYASHVNSAGFSGEIDLNQEIVVEVDLNQAIIREQIINAGLIEEFIETTTTPPVSEQPEPTPPEDISEGTTDDGQCGTINDPETVVEEYTTASGNSYKIDITYRGMSDNVFVYFPWVRGDGTDAYKKVIPYFMDIPGTWIGITLTGCENGCNDWNPPKWVDNVEDFISRPSPNHCIGTPPKYYFIGSSIGANLALRFCSQMDDCKAAIAISPDEFIGDGVSLVDDISLMGPGNQGIVAWGELDPQMVALEAYSGQLDWTRENGFDMAVKDGLIFIRVPGSSKHGDELYTGEFWLNIFNLLDW